MVIDPYDTHGDICNESYSAVLSAPKKKQQTKKTKP